MLGFRIRDPATGALRLDLADYTVKIVQELNITISGSGSYSVSGIDAANYGAFLFPTSVDNWGNNRTYSEDVSRNRPMMPRVSISQNTVNWLVGLNYTARTWRLIVVKYT